jgi:hypothetical protein
MLFQDVIGNDIESSTLTLSSFAQCQLLLLGHRSFQLRVKISNWWLEDDNDDPIFDNNSLLLQ